MSESVTRQAKKTHMDRPGHGTELYTPRPEYKGTIYGQGRFCGKFWYFAENSGILAENSGYATLRAGQSSRRMDLAATAAGDRVT